MHPSLNLEALWPSPPKRALPRRRSRSLRTSLARAVFPRVMEFKVISRESEKHEFMPVVYLIDRSPAWHRRVPSVVETAIVEDYITPLVAEIPDANAADMTQVLASVRKEMELRANLIDETKLDNVSTDERDYKMGVLVDFAPTPGNPGKAALNRVLLASWMCDDMQAFATEHLSCWKSARWRSLEKIRRNSHSILARDSVLR
ncbi:hypothetical protein PHPALM_12126 [Phytophthora palmivora]|uniref:Uncharacterized protein n=1 Tax=Phytophthora palmivora TaxID=4796 RepID=A0A2P4Y0J6_9STRA|nr:hypothetical protein PHPALM_12126 [Phytophthora palmivora]